MTKKNLINKNDLIKYAKESLAEPTVAEMPKKEYAEPVKKKPAVDRQRLEADLYELVYAAGGQAPGYRRQLNKILDEHL